MAPRLSQCATDRTLPSDTTCLSCSGSLAQGIGLVSKMLLGSISTPERALVLCVDEKLLIQTLNRRSGLPMWLGLPSHVTHNSTRHDTASPFALKVVSDGPRTKRTPPSAPDHLPGDRPQRLQDQEHSAARIRSLCAGAITGANPSLDQKWKR